MKKEAIIFIQIRKQTVLVSLLENNLRVEYFECRHIKYQERGEEASNLGYRTAGRGIDGFQQITALPLVVAKAEIKQQLHKMKKKKKKNFFTKNIKSLKKKKKKKKFLQIFFSLNIKSLKKKKARLQKRHVNI